MFTGIVEDTGTVTRTETEGGLLRVTIAAPRLSVELPRGGSIAVDGCCLTAVAGGDGCFTCELTPETLRRTAFGARLKEGARVNLERPMRADGRFDGHIVQGHVDAVGHIAEMRPVGGGVEMAVQAPDAVARYLVEKGSVAVDGVSLTVAGLGRATFWVALIPFTLQVTRFGEAEAGDAVNLEVDVLAKYVERLLSSVPGAAGRRERGAARTRRRL